MLVFRVFDDWCIWRNALNGFIHMCAARGNFANQIKAVFFLSNSDYGLNHSGF